MICSIYCSKCFTYQLIDERSKQYSSAGDDKVNQTITDLVRGPLASGIKQMLEQVTKILESWLDLQLYLIPRA